VQVAPVSSTVDVIEQSVYFVEKRNKPVLLSHFLNNTATTRVLVFTRTKHGADKVARHLERSGIPSAAIHGNKNQNARNRAIAQFKSQEPPVLVATDIAARGLDIDAVSHVVNYDVPNVPETYVHRIGRTGRAGATGAAVSFCDPEERSFIQAIEKLTRRRIPVQNDHPEYPARAATEERESHARDAHPRQHGGGHRSERSHAHARPTVAHASHGGHNSGGGGGAGAPAARTNHRFHGFKRPGRPGGRPASRRR
jgi:ATP-dependent RNA helicase RhlE